MGDRIIHRCNGDIQSGRCIGRAIGGRIGDLWNRAVIVRIRGKGEGTIRIQRDVTNTWNGGRAVGCMGACHTKHGVGHNRQGIEIDITVIGQYISGDRTTVLNTGGRIIDQCWTIIDRCHGDRNCGRFRHTAGGDGIGECIGPVEVGIGHIDDLA